MREKPHAESSALRRFGRSASRAARKLKDLFLFVPLAAGIALAPACQSDPCRSYNETTVSLNRETDGRSIGTRGLLAVEPGFPLSEPLVDLINETHAISSRGMPEDVKATSVSEGCRVYGSSDGYSMLSSGLVSGARSADRGIYIPDKDMDNIWLYLTTLNHEIGHLQHPKSKLEVFSKLNAYEQALSGFALLQKQGYPEDELIRWVYHTEEMGLARAISNVLQAVAKGHMDLSDADDYVRANVFLFTRLPDFNGDFGGLREDAARRMDDLKDDTRRITREFFDTRLGMAVADVMLDGRGLAFNHILKNFGPSAARAYFNTTSKLVGSTPASGLDGLSCVDSPAIPITGPGDGPCSDEDCQALKANMRRPLDATLCCLQLEPDGTLSRHSVTVSGLNFWTAGDDSKVEVEGFKWPRYLSLNITSMARLAPDEPCK